MAAIRRLAEVTFDHHEAHPGFIRLVSIENVHHAAHIAELARLVDLNSTAIQLISGILDRGRVQAVFRGGVDAVDVHMMISSYCFFRVANRHTFGALFGRDLLNRVGWFTHETGIGHRHDPRPEPAPTSTNALHALSGWGEALLGAYPMNSRRKTLGAPAGRCGGVSH